MTMIGNHQNERYDTACPLWVAGLRAILLANCPPISKGNCTLHDCSWPCH